MLVYAPPCNRWTFGSRGPPSLRWNKQAIRWALADETIQRSFLRTIDEAFSARAGLFVLPPTLSLHHWYEEVATMIRSTATKHFGQHTETARAGWMTADAWTSPSAPTTRDQTAHPVDCICRSVSSFHVQIVENLAIDGLGFPRGS